MLNSKLVKTGLFTIAMMFLVLVARPAGTQPPADSIKLTLNDSLQRTAQAGFATMRLPVLNTPPPIRLNKQAAKFTDDYIARNTEMLEKIKAKSSNTFTVIDAVLCKYQLPVELKYLAVIESQLKTTARSKVGAVGTWQFMPATARILSLKVTSKYDERKHLYKSTVAAAKYLNDLHDIFGDWLLVIAAYNAGPGNVMKAIKKSGSRNFWKLQQYLPAETRGHVKKFISTQYYFEGKAGLTTLTKEETHVYNQTLAAFVAKQNEVIEKEVPDDQPLETQVGKMNTSTAGILNEEEYH